VAVRQLALQQQMDWHYLRRRDKTFGPAERFGVLRVSSFEEEGGGVLVLFGSHDLGHCIECTAIGEDGCPIRSLKRAKN
jgi:hypothetical protein